MNPFVAVTGGPVTGVNVALPVTLSFFVFLSSFFPALVSLIVE